MQMAILKPQPRPRRRIRWQTPATLLVLLGILAGGAWWGWNSLTESTAEPACEVKQLPNGRLTPNQVVLNVYNGGARSGTAGDTAAFMKKRGFQIDKVANEPNDQKVAIVAVRGAAKDAPEVQLVLKQLKQPAPVVVDQRTTHTVDLLVGPGFKGLSAGAKFVPVKGGTACIPPSKTPAPVPSGQNPG